MTVSLDGTTYMGLPILKVRDILKAWDRDRDVGRVSSLGSVATDPRNVLAVLAGLEANGLMGEVADEGHVTRGVRWGLSDKGKGLAFASGRKRVPKRVAFGKLERLLDNVEGVNADPRAPLHVDRVWLFGSMVDGSRPDVGDIDHVVECSPGPAHGSWRVPEEVLLADYGHLVPASLGYPERYSLTGYVLNKLLYGTRRDPCLAPNDIETLCELHVPCRLVFDRASGGRVDGPLLPHHPDSLRRADTVNERLAMPDLEAGPPARFVPSSARLLDCRSLPLGERGIGLPVGALATVRRRVGWGEYPGPEVAFLPAVGRAWGLPESLCEGLDGKSRAVLAYRTRAARKGGGIRWMDVERALDGAEADRKVGIRLSCRIGAGRRGAAASPAAEATAFAAGAMLLLAADLARLQGGSPDPRHVTLEVEGSDAGKWTDEVMRELASFDPACFTEHLPLPALVTVDIRVPAKPGRSRGRRGRDAEMACGPGAGGPSS